MFRWAANRWHGRKKTAEETMSYDSLIELLKSMDKSVIVNLSGSVNGCIIFESTGEIGDEGPVLGESVSSKEPSPNMANLMEVKLKPYSKKYWEAIHEVYSGKGIEKHYIEFMSIAPIKKVNCYVVQVKLGPQYHRYYATLEFIVETEQPKEPIQKE